MGLARWLRVVGGSLCLVCCSKAVLAQAPAAAPPPVTAAAAKTTFPANAAELDTLLSQRNYAKLSQIFRDTKKYEDVVLNMNWQQVRLFTGGTAFLAFPYIADLDRVGSALWDARGADMKKTAIIIFLYAYELTLIDGQRCKDVSAPAHRKDQLITGYPNLRKSIAALSDEEMDEVLKTAVKMEGISASRRTDDDYLCRGGMKEVNAALTKYGDSATREIPTPPGGVGKSMALKMDPDFKPEFLTKEVWLPKQAELRPQLPEILSNLVSGVRKKK